MPTGMIPIGRTVVVEARRNLTTSVLLLFIVYATDTTIALRSGKIPTRLRETKIDKYR